MTRQEFLRVLPEAIQGYQPSKDTLRKTSELSLVMFVGPTGVGKTTLIKASGYHYVPSDNSRLPRPGELEGVDFFFRQDYDQLLDDIKTGHFLQVAIDGSGDLKATRASSYPESGIVAMAIMWNVVPQFRNLGFKETFSTFIVPPSFEEWQRRLAHQNLSTEQLHKRQSEAKDSFIFGLADPYVHLVLNDNVVAATSQIHRIVAGKIDRDRESLARQAAKDILNRLD